MAGVARLGAMNDEIVPELAHMMGRPIRYGGTVFVDPRINAGRPSFVETGVRIIDVENRVAAGEPIAEVADDYDLDPDEIVRVIAADRAA